MDGFCATVRDFVADDNAMPAPEQGGTIAEIQNGTSRILAGYAGILSEAISERTVLGHYTVAHDTATWTQTALDAAVDDVDAQAAVVDALIAAQQEALAATDPVAPVVADPVLSHAAALAPHCRP